MTQLLPYIVIFTQSIFIPPLTGRYHSVNTEVSSNRLLNKMLYFHILKACDKLQQKALRKHVKK